MRTGEPRPPIVLTDPSVLIGAGDAAQIRLKSQSVSKAHALVLVQDGKAYVRDLASRTHLFVNEAPVREAFLGDGDVVRVGRFGFGVRENAAARARPHDRVAPVVRLRMSDTGMERVVGGRVILIGRRHGCDVIVPNHTLSGAHAVLFRVGGQWWVRDLGSRAGTLVNGAEVRQQRALSAGDLLQLGAVEVQFIGEALAGATTAPVQREEAAPARAAAPVAEPERGEPGEWAVDWPGAAAAPGTSGVPETGNVVPGAVEGGAAMAVAGEAPLPDVPAAEPPAAPVEPPPEPARPRLFADAPIARAEIETPAPPAPAVELPPLTDVPPVVAPERGALEEVPAAGDRSGDEMAVSVYRDGNGDGDGGVDEDSGDEDVEETEGEGSSAGLETQPPATEQEWDEAVTVWSFAELAQRGRERSSRDEASVAPVTAASPWSDRRRWLWVTVGAAIACLAVLVTLLAHRLW